MKTLHRYNPRGFVSLTAYYEITAHEKGGRWHPEIMPEIEWIEVHANGRALDENASTVFFETFGERWEREILIDYGYSL